MSSTQKKATAGRCWKPVLEAERPYKRIGITLRTALLSWLVTLVTLLIFITVILPQQKLTFQENLKSKAHGLAASLHSVAAGAVNDDLTGLVDHCTSMIKDDQALEYLVITKNDGSFALFHDRRGWRYETNASRDWRPLDRVPTSGIGLVPTFNRRVFHYSLPFNCANLQWGWIHVGLSLASYDRSVAFMYQNTTLLALLCILISLLASMIYAKRLVQPILSLRQMVHQVASGDLSVRAEINRGDELGGLAGSVNLMTEALLRRDRILQSVRFAAQEFLGAVNWQDVIQEILGKLGEAAAVSRIQVFENRLPEQNVGQAVLRHEWVAASNGATLDAPHRTRSNLLKADFAQWAEKLSHGNEIQANAREMEAPQHQQFQAVGVKALLAIPILVERSWWGVLILVDGQSERQWTEERDSIRAVADMLGATITRQRTQNALVEAKATLEQRVDERTKELREQVITNEQTHAELAEAQQSLIESARESEAQLKTILNSVRTGIMLIDAETHEVVEANTFAIEMLGVSSPQVIGKVCHGFLCPAERGRCPITDQHQRVEASERVLLKPDGQSVPIVKSAVMINRHGRDYLLESFLDITELKKAEAELKRLHQQLVEISRQAGMAEVATGVLHNVGNVLNSVNVSTTLVCDRIRQSKIASLVKAAQLLREHEQDMALFIAHDPRGQRLPSLLIKLADHLETERTGLLEELHLLAKNIGHIKDIVAMQQSYAKVSGITESLSLPEVLDDALQMNGAALQRHEIQVIRDYQEVPVVPVDKHKLLQILLNLIRNAKYAMHERPGSQAKCLRIGLALNGHGRVKITVQDNGIGISPENLTRIFSHGFTTKKDGHGFGLHMGALAAREMGGSLSAFSDGLCQGAVFVLELPATPAGSPA